MIMQHGNSEKRSPNGLFWQYDVRDAMEETISGGRKEKNPRPVINGICMVMQWHCKTKLTVQVMRANYIYQQSRF
jgi:hypothetical protein